jgi:FixJ family two-component response regulator
VFVQSPIWFVWPERSAFKGSFATDLGIERCPNGQLDSVRRHRHSSAMAEASPWIAIVDDDPSVLKALARLLRTREFNPRTFDSAQDFLATIPNEMPECLILDLQMPQLSGVEVLQQLAARSIRIPTIIVTAHGDVETRRRCKEYPETIAFLLKPVQEVALFDAIQTASSR